MVRNRILFAQNFLKSSALVAKLISNSSISDEDVVYEIGPGNGIITTELLHKSKKVVVIELDPNLVKKLRALYDKNNKIEIHEGDFLNFQIPSTKFKVFSNIPFNITSDIVRKLLYSTNTPEDAYLIMQQEAAMKFSGVPEETEFSVLAKPWYSFDTTWEFQKNDFFPKPSVDSVLLHIHKREKPLLEKKDAELFKKFVSFGFRAWKKNLKIAYKDIFTYEQWKRLAKNNGFSIKTIPSQLTFEQWLSLFAFLSEKVVPTKWRYLG